MRLIETPFGRAVDLAPEVRGAEAMVVALNDYGRLPRRLLLTHQLYVRTAREILDEAHHVDPYIEVLPIYRRDSWIRLNLDELESRYAPESAVNEGSQHG
jgi:hypothetical protein